MENLEDLKKTLKLELNTHNMLNNTLAEMYEKNSNVNLIEDVQDEINALEKDIKFIQEQIHINSPKGDGVKKSFFNEIKKPKLVKSIKDESVKAKSISLYDSIQKPKFDNEKEVETNKKLAYKEIYQKACSNLLAFDNAISANRFLVRFEGEAKVPEWYVRRVTFTPSDRKELYIEIFDFLTENNRPIITQFANQNIPFRISIDHLDPCGVVLYTERYHGCNVVSIRKNDLAYNIDEKWSMELEITYSDISYETSH